MKPIRLYILIPLFLFWLIVGYLIAGTLLPGNSFQTLSTSNEANALTPVPSPSSFSEQGNVLLLIVDDLTRSKPNLVSSWALFIALKGHPSLVMKAIYLPKHDPDEQEEAQDPDVLITTVGQLSPLVVDRIRSTGFEWKYFIVTDIPALSSTSEWITGSPLQKDLPSPSDLGITGINIDDQVNILKDICNHLSVSEKERGPQPAWSVLIPAHLVTDLPLSTSIAQGDRFTRSNPAPHCEIIATP